ncbi:MAG: patatin-like phospholipase family protein [Burkholderiales bacterium]|jgi:NTE family protein|nr:patatin-like phospholipase family protein [Burkholderiales bacterium]
MKNELKIGIALGAGSARGWAHIGVLRALAKAGIRPQIVCGSSIGALVGAVHAAGQLDALEDWVLGLTWRKVLGFFDISFNGGFLKGAKLITYLEDHLLDRSIEELELPFAAVATDLRSGREIWLREGRAADAVRASIALPGLFTPVERDGRLLVDGALVNPVPVSLCRAMGADVVIGVDLGSGRMARREGAGRRDKSLNMIEVVAESINIMQARITRSRLAGEPADVLITPLLEDIGTMEYHRAEQAIAEGRAAAEVALPQIRRLL